MQAWSEQLARDGSVTLGLAPRTAWMFRLTGALLVAAGAYFFLREDSTPLRVFSALGLVWGVVLVCIPTLPPLRRRFEIVVDATGIHTTTALVPWPDLVDIEVGAVGGRQAVLLRISRGTLSSRSRRLANAEATYLPYTLPGTPTALASWLSDEWHRRNQKRPTT